MNVDSNYSPLGHSPLREDQSATSSGLNVSGGSSPATTNPSRSADTSATTVPHVLQSLTPVQDETGTHFVDSSPPTNPPPTNHGQIVDEQRSGTSVSHRTATASRFSQFMEKMKGLPWKEIGCVALIGVGFVIMFEPSGVGLILGLILITAGVTGLLIMHQNKAAEKRAANAATQEEQGRATAQEEQRRATLEQQVAQMRASLSPDSQSQPTPSPPSQSTPSSTTSATNSGSDSAVSPGTASSNSAASAADASSAAPTLRRGLRPPGTIPKSLSPSSTSPAASSVSPATSSDTNSTSSSSTIVSSGPPPKSEANTDSNPIPSRSNQTQSRPKAMSGGPPPVRHPGGPLPPIPGASIANSSTNINPSISSSPSSPEPTSTAVQPPSLRPTDEGQLHLLPKGLPALAPPPSLDPMTDAPIFRPPSVLETLPPIDPSNPSLPPVPSPQMVESSVSGVANTAANQANKSAAARLFGNIASLFGLMGRSNESSVT